MAWLNFFSLRTTIFLGITVLIALIAILGGVFFLALSSAPQGSAGLEQFVIPLETSASDALARLHAEGFIKSPWAFNLALKWKGVIGIEPGGYMISRSMNVWKLADVFKTKPALAWVVIPEGVRKEEIAEILGKKLGWDEAVQNEWLTVHTRPDFEHSEGVYFPDTYLIPADEPPENVAKRLRAKFDEKFAPYLPEAYKQNIRWPTLIRVASLIEREAAGEHDMKLISGIIWNRLLIDMKLDIDATLQYAKGKTDGRWWGPVSPEDKNIDSPYNTYKRKGLPPLPIGNPGLKTIEAALYPEKTKCLYYLHDENKEIHCAVSYKEHQANVELFLKR